MGLRSRLSWVVLGPARLDEIERSVQALQSQIDELMRRQDDTLDGLRTSVRDALDDLSARLSTIDGDARAAGD